MQQLLGLSTGSCPEESHEWPGTDYLWFVDGAFRCTGEPNRRKGLRLKMTSQLFGPTKDGRGVTARGMFNSGALGLSFWVNRRPHLPVNLLSNLSDTFAVACLSVAVPCSGLNMVDSCFQGLPIAKRIRVPCCLRDEQKRGHQTRKQFTQQAASRGERVSRGRKSRGVRLLRYTHHCRLFFILINYCDEREKKNRAFMSFNFRCCCLVRIRLNPEGFNPR